MIDPEPGAEPKLGQEWVFDDYRPLPRSVSGVPLLHMKRVRRITALGRRDPVIDDPESEWHGKRDCTFGSGWLVQWDHGEVEEYRAWGGLLNDEPAIKDPAPLWPPDGVCVNDGILAEGETEGYRYHDEVVGPGAARKAADAALDKYIQRREKR